MNHPQEMAEAIRKILFDNFYTGEPGEHDAIKTAVAAISALFADVEETIAELEEESHRDYQALESEMGRAHILLRKARKFIADSGCDEDDSEVNAGRDELLTKIDAALSADSAASEKTREALNVKSICKSIKDDRCIEVWLTAPVTAEDRAALTAILSHS